MWLVWVPVCLALQGSRRFFSRCLLAGLVGVVGIVRDVGGTLMVRVFLPLSSALGILFVGYPSIRSRLLPFATRDMKLSSPLFSVIKSSFMSGSSGLFKYGFLPAIMVGAGSCLIGSNSS